MAGTPDFIIADPMKTKATYAKAMVIAVLNSVKAQPCVFENVERPLHQCLKCI
jgi:hypothetical protein